MKSSRALMRFMGAAVAIVVSLSLPATSASADQTGIAGQVTNEAGQPIPNDAATHLTAAQIWVPGSALSTVNVVLGIGSGTLRGRITDVAGAGDPNTTVTIYAQDRNWSSIAYTWDFADGNYEFPNIAPGTYKVSIYSNDRGTQWISGKESQDLATVFTVADGGIVTADDQWLSQGSAKITLRDSQTGALVPRPCVYIQSTPQPRNACGRNGVITLPDVPPGYWSMTVTAAPSHFMIENDHIEIIRGQQTEIERTMAAGAGMTTKVLDSVTGLPAESICVHVVLPGTGGQSAHMSMDCADSSTDGTLNIGPFAEPFEFQLYAFQVRNPWVPPTILYGDQWVGATGGTGDQRAAAVIKLQSKTVVNAPVIKMDLPGTITGTVRDKATGNPVPGVCAYPYAFHNGQGGIFGQHCSNANGTYVIDDIGPYQWPVEFLGNTWQWSGDVGDRFAASYTQVTSGGTATMNANIAAPAQISGTATGPGTDITGYAYAFNAKTGDLAGPWTNANWPNGSGTFTMKGLATQDVHLQLWFDKECWYGVSGAGYPGRRNPARLQGIPVVAGQTKTLTFDTAANCAQPAGPPAPRRVVPGSGGVGFDTPADAAWGRRIAAFAAQVGR